MTKILIIQTAFLGDVILATAVVEKLHQFYPASKIDFLLRKGNESLLENHPIIDELIIWDKKNKKYDKLRAVFKKVKRKHYDVVVNLQRFASSGMITAFSGAKQKIGFKKNPLAFSFTKSFPHQIGDGTHEIERNQQLIVGLTDEKAVKPKLYPSKKDFESVKIYKDNAYVCIAPTSVWSTKELPKEQWVKLIAGLEHELMIYLLGGSIDFEKCEEIKELANGKKVINLCGKLSLLASAALMQDAQMNYVNDSAPLHIASAMNAPVTAYFCSTQPSFGFGPLSDKKVIIEIKEDLPCRPCGLHGKKICPKGHFDCGYKIEI